MSVSLVQFPLTVSEWEKSVAYMTDVITGRNGQEVRNAIWQDPLLSFNASFSIRTYADIGTLTNFFHAMRGREKAFLVKDWADYAVTDWTQSSDTANGTRTTFQLVKRYTQTIGGSPVTYVRPIKFPKTDTVTGLINGTTPATISSVNASTGVVTLSSAPSNGHSVEFKVGEFYVPARFDIDELPVEMLNYWVASGADKSNVQVPDIPLREVRI
jgi:uncharacterized protein (TIGR02217 family)